MTFLVAHPFFLSLLPLALAPVVFHLFFRIRRKAVAFSTFMFFQRIHPRLSARRKLRDWLILLLRTLAVALLLMALAGPLWTSAGHGGRTAAVLVLDNSASMSRRAESGELLIEAAKNAAEAALATLDPGDSAALVLTVRDPAAPEAGTLGRDRNALRASLKAVPPTEAAGNPADALRLALAQLATAPAARREIHVFTDLQENEWARPATAIAAPAGLAILFHRLVPGEPPPNATLLAVSLPHTRRLASRRLPLSVRVRAGGQPASFLLNWTEDGGRPGAVEVRLAADEEKAVILPLAPRAPGSYAVPVWISGDGFEGDNRAITAFDVWPSQAILFLGPRPAFGFLPAALAPGGNAALSGLTPVFADPAEATAALARTAPLLAVIPWTRLPAAGTLSDALKHYVQGGGRLLALPDPATSAPNPIPAWLGAEPGAVEAPSGGARLIPLDKDQPLFDSLRDPAGQVRLRQIQVRRFSPLAPAPGSIPLLGLEDGRALLTQRTEGAGRVFVCGLALDGAWSTWPLKPGFLPLVQHLALGDRSDPGVTPSIRAGDRFPVMPAGRGRLTADTVPPIQWQGDTTQIPVPSRSGVWTLECATGTIHVAVSADPGEGRFVELGNGPVPAAQGLPHTVETFHSARELAAKIRHTRQGTRLFHPLLIACLLAMLAESLLANPRIKGA